MPITYLLFFYFLSPVTDLSSAYATFIEVFDSFPRDCYRPGTQWMPLPELDWIELGIVPCEHNGVNEKDVDTYRDALEHLPADNPRNDRSKILVRLAHTLWLLERHEEALVHFRELTKTYEQNVHIPDAYLAFGLYYLNRYQRLEPKIARHWHSCHHVPLCEQDREKSGRLLSKALHSFKMAAKYRDWPWASYAEYLIGRCLLDFNEWKEAQVRFEKVLSMLHRAVEKKPWFQACRDAALAGLLSIFQKHGKASVALDFFRHVTSGRADILLNDLLHRYLCDRSQETLVLAQLLLEENRNLVISLYYANKILEASSTLSPKDKTMQRVKELKKAIEEFRHRESSLNNEERDLLSLLEQQSEKIIRKLTLMWYRKAK